MSVSQLGRLADQAWGLFERAVANPNNRVVQLSMPVLYFGDREAYSRSPLKIVTVGLNPSWHEFPPDDPWLRFPAGMDRETYLDSLSSYFVTEPYRGWFGAFECVLAGMNAGYYGDRENVALHTDICSPLATNPTWSKLHDAVELCGDGFPLWRALVEVLEPDVVVASVAQSHLLRLTPEPVDAWPVIHVLERPKPYLVRMRELSVGAHTTIVAFGRAAQRPFGTVADRDKPAIGAAINVAVAHALIQR